MKIKIACNPENFASVQNEDEFAVLVALARCVNQVRFAVHSLDALGDTDNSPFAKRQQTTAFLITALTLLEGVELARVHTGKHFRAFSEFALLPELWRKQEYRDLLKRHLLPARNMSVAHFDYQNVHEVLGQLTFVNECVFAEGFDSASDSVFYVLADALAVMTMIGPTSSADERRTRMEEVIRALGRLAGEFVLRVDALITRVLTAKGFQVYEETGG